MGFATWYDEHVVPRIIKCACSSPAIMALRLAYVGDAISEIETIAVQQVKHPHQTSQCGQTFGRFKDRDGLESAALIFDVSHLRRGVCDDVHI